MTDPTVEPDLVRHGMQVVRDFRPPEGLSSEEVDANGDGELLAVLDLRPDTELQVRPIP